MDKQSSPHITALFLDIGGVLLTNGWGRNSRKKAAEHFGINYEEMDERHHLTFNAFEEGKLSLNEYLHRIVFFEKRNFSYEEFRQFMYDVSKPYYDMIDLIRSVKDSHGLKTIAVSNEGKELTEYRIMQFELDKIIDFFVSSCFVHVRKPDKDIFDFALNLSQSKPENVIYIDDRALFVDVAKQYGLHGIVHENTEKTAKALEEAGLSINY